MHKYFLLSLLTIFFSAKMQGQSNFKKQIDSFRHHYIAELLADERSPIKAADTNALRFYKANPKFAVPAIFHRVQDTIGFDMQTHSGVIKKYYVYGELHFTMAKQTQTLLLYQSKSLMANPEYEDYLFLPFTDNTNYKSTFGGGRYIDLKIKDVADGTLTLDFNRAYNPYCAFKGGYNCPIPPAENKLSLYIKAGEKLPALPNVH